MAGRYGVTEGNTILRYMGRQMGLQRKYKRGISWNAGFFPFTDSAIDQFAELMIECSQYADVIASISPYDERYTVPRIAPQALVVEGRAIEPYYHDNPWSRSLQGKRVLVIHPFADTICLQYSKRQHLFRNQEILPDFELITYKSVQSITDEEVPFETWFDALNYMTEEIGRFNFDVAILGCGAYGFPLAIRIKQMGKQAIHMGGATQILFGIKGGRWDNHPIISKFYNEYWVRPSISERPAQANTIESGCYW